MNIYGYGNKFFSIYEIEYKYARQYGNFVFAGLSAEQYRYFTQKNTSAKRNFFALVFSVFQRIRVSVFENVTEIRLTMNVKSEKSKTE